MARVMTLSIAGIVLLLLGLGTQFPGFTKTCGHPKKFFLPRGIKGSECQKSNSPSPSNDSPSSSVQHSCKIDCHICSSSNAGPQHSCSSLQVCPSSHVSPSVDTCPISISCNPPHTCPLDHTTTSPRKFCSGDNCVEIHACPSSANCLTINICPSYNHANKPDDLANVPGLAPKPPSIEDSPSAGTTVSSGCSPDNCPVKSQTTEPIQTPHKSKSSDTEITPKEQDVSMAETCDIKCSHHTPNMKDILQDYAFYDEVDPKILAYPDSKKKQPKKPKDIEPVFKFEISDAIDYEQQRTHECNDEFWSSVIDNLLVESVDKAEEEMHKDPKDNVEGQQAMKQEILDMEANVLLQTLCDSNGKEESILQGQQQIMQEGMEEGKRTDDVTKEVKEADIQTTQQIPKKEGLTSVNDGSGAIKVKVTQTQQQSVREEVELVKADNHTQAIKETVLQAEQQILKENKVLKRAGVGLKDVKEMVVQTMQHTDPQATDDSVKQAHDMAKEAESAMEDISQILEQVVLEAQVAATDKATDVVADVGDTVEDLQRTMEKYVHAALDKSLNETTDIVKGVQEDMHELQEVMRNVQIEAMKNMVERGEEISRKDLEEHEKADAKSDRTCESQCSRNEMRGIERKEGTSVVTDTLNDILKDVDKKTVRESYPFLSKEKSVVTKPVETCAQQGKRPIQSKPSSCCKGYSDGSKERERKLYKRRR